MTELYDKACLIIEDAFKNKTDLGGFPYTGHLYRVSSKVEGDLKIVALLHDLLEDCEEWTECRLLTEFPKSIVELVVLLTRLPNESYADYIQKVCQNNFAIKVKIADLEDNMDVTRFPTPLTEREFIGLSRYHNTWLYLISKNV